MRTLVVSDLHLGLQGDRDVLRRPEPLAGLCARLDGVDRLVLLGDVVEMRQGPLHRSMEAAEPVLRAIGDALVPGAEVVIVPGNHDHAFVAPWLRARAADAPPPPLGLEERAGPGPSDVAARVSSWLGAGRTTFAYPGVWLREDVWATHGHYLDRLTTLPTMERLAAGVMTRIVGPVPEAATPDDFEAALAPIYAWLLEIANQPAGGGWSRRGENPSAKVWMALAGDGRRPLRARALASSVPLTVAMLNRAGLGPLRSEVSGEELRRASLRALGEAVTRLGVPARHIVVGHTHRAGPLPGDHAHEWLVPATGAHIHNGGCWVDEPLFFTTDPEGPYRAGRATIVEDDGPPRVERLVSDLGRTPDPPVPA